MSTISFSDIGFYSNSGSGSIGFYSNSGNSGYPSNSGNSGYPSNSGYGNVVSAYGLKECLQYSANGGPTYSGISNIKSNNGTYYTKFN